MTYWIEKVGIMIDNVLAKHGADQHHSCAGRHELTAYVNDIERAKSRTQQSTQNPQFVFEAPVAGGNFEGVALITNSAAQDGVGGARGVNLDLPPLPR
jgi:hypothetical protein